MHGRYLGAAEAAWRLYEFLVHGNTPAVVALVVHPPNHHIVASDADAGPVSIANKAEFSTTTLLAFFEYYKRPPDTPKYVYHELPRHFVLKKRAWHPRQTTAFQIGRVHPVSPFQGEVYYIRCLLTVAPVPSSFEDLRTVNGVLQPSFEGTCYVRGIIGRGMEWIDCFK